MAQLIDSPTRPNIKCPSRSSLLDLFLTNNPHKYTSTGVFANDLSDHCAIGIVRNAKLPKPKPQILIKRDLRHFNEQTFLQGLSHIKWSRIYVIKDIDMAWKCFLDQLQTLINKHAPLRRFRVKGRSNPWFSSEIGNLLRERDVAWAKARETKTEDNWLLF